MAGIATYDDLTAAVARWLRRTDLTADIPTFIQLTEAHLNREWKLKDQLAEVSLPITGEFVNRPIGFRQVRAWRLIGSTGRFLTYVTPEQMNELKAQPTVAATIPRNWTIIGAQFEFFPVPDVTYQSLLTLQTAITPLSMSNETNWILADHPDVYLYGALFHSAPMLKADDRISMWKDLFETPVAEVGYALRAMFDQRLRVDRALRTRGRFRGGFNILTGE